MLQESEADFNTAGSSVSALGLFLIPQKALSLWRIPVCNLLAGQRRPAWDKGELSPLIR